MGFALSDMKLTSPSIEAGGNIPRKHTGEGDDVTPALAFNTATTTALNNDLSNFTLGGLLTGQPYVRVPAAGPDPEQGAGHERQQVPGGKEPLGHRRTATSPSRMRVTRSRGLKGLTM